RTAPAPGSSRRRPFLGPSVVRGSTSSRAGVRTFRAAAAQAAAGDEADFGAARAGCDAGAGGRLPVIADGARRAGSETAAGRGRVGGDSAVQGRGRTRFATGDGRAVGRGGAGAGGSVAVGLGEGAGRAGRFSAAREIGRA